MEKGSNRADETGRLVSVGHSGFPIAPLRLCVRPRPRCNVVLYRRLAQRPRPAGRKGDRRRRGEGGGGSPPRPPMEGPARAADRAGGFPGGSGGGGALRSRGTEPPPRAHATSAGRGESSFLCAEAARAESLRIASAVEPVREPAARNVSCCRRFCSF